MVWMKSLTNLVNLIDQNIVPDVTIVTRDGKIFLHRLVLVSLIPWVKELLCNECLSSHEDIVIFLPDSENNHVGEIVREVYSTGRRDMLSEILSCQEPLVNKVYTNNDKVNQVEDIHKIFSGRRLKKKDDVIRKLSNNRVKKRGRPKTLENVDQLEMVDSECVVKNEQPSEVSPSTEKRRRGRPRKVKQEIPEPCTLEDSIAIRTSEASSTNIDACVKHINENIDNTSLSIVVQDVDEFLLTGVDERVLYDDDDIFNVDEQIFSPMSDIADTEDCIENFESTSTKKHKFLLNTRELHQGNYNGDIVADTYEDGNLVQDQRMNLMISTKKCLSYPLGESIEDEIVDNPDATEFIESPKSFFIDKALSIKTYSNKKNKLSPQNPNKEIALDALDIDLTNIPFDIVLSSELKVQANTSDFKVRKLLTKRKKIKKIPVVQEILRPGDVIRRKNNGTNNFSITRYDTSNPKYVYVKRLIGGVSQGDEVIVKLNHFESVMKPVSVNTSFLTPLTNRQKSTKIMNFPHKECSLPFNQQEVAIPEGWRRKVFHREPTNKRKYLRGEVCFISPDSTRLRNVVCLQKYLHERSMMFPNLGLEDFDFCPYGAGTNCPRYVVQVGRVMEEEVDIILTELKKSFITKNNNDLEYGDLITFSDKLDSVHQVMLKKTVVELRIVRGNHISLNAFKQRHKVILDRMKTEFQEKVTEIIKGEHQVIGEETIENGYACKECGKVFTQISNLREHLPMHTGERAYSCVKCGETFKSGGHLKKHSQKCIKTDIDLEGIEKLKVKLQED